jgi:two-component system response regulator FixJ
MLHKTVFIVDDDPAVRDATSLLLSLHGHPSATFHCAEDLLAAWTPQWLGCLVLDVRMPGISGLALQKELAQRGSRLPVIIITAHGDVAAAREAFLADAVDFLEKPFTPEALLAAVEAAWRRLPVAAEAPARTERLTAREREVAVLLAEGMANREIGERLGISPRTVEVHKARVMDKTGARHVVELARLLEASGG